MTETGIIFDIRKYSIHDGPGIRTTVFFKGCPLNCWWCHNPESKAQNVELMYRENRCIGCSTCQEVCQAGAVSWQNDRPVTDLSQCDLCGVCVDVCYAEARQIIGKQMTVAQVLAEIERDVPFYDSSAGGVTFSGGEPLQQRSFLAALLRACKRNEIHTTLDTCGFAAWETFELIRHDVDVFLYDLKLMDDERHRRFTGVSNRLILENLSRLAEEHHRVILRMPVIPNVNTDAENIRQVGEFASRLPSLERIDLLPYHQAGAEKYNRLSQEYRLPSTPAPSDDLMAEIAAFLESFRLTIHIGG